MCFEIAEKQTRWRTTTVYKFFEMKPTAKIVLHSPFQATLYRLGQIKSLNAKQLEDVKDDFRPACAREGLYVYSSLDSAIYAARQNNPYKEGDITVVVESEVNPKDFIFHGAHHDSVMATYKKIKPKKIVWRSDMESIV